MSFDLNRRQWLLAAGGGVAGYRIDQQALG